MKIVEIHVFLEFGLVLNIEFRAWYFQNVRKMLTFPFKCLLFLVFSLVIS